MIQPAHVEIVALCNAAQNIQNYRLLSTTILCHPWSLVPCVRARFYIAGLGISLGASDYKTGAVGLALLFFDDYK